MLEAEQTKQNVWFFWTITLDGKDHESNNPHVDSLKLWREKWDKLMKRVRRDMKPYGKKMRYVRVFEPHKSGILHVHMLTDIAYNDIQEFEQWNNVTKQNDIVWHSETFEKHLTELDLGKIHDIRPIETEDETDNGVARNVSAYVTKYMTKDIQNTMRELLKENGLGRVRLLQTSQQFGVIPDREDKLDWELGRLTKIAHDSLPADNHAKDVQRDTVIEEDDFHGTDKYPNRYSDLEWLAVLMDNDT